MGTVKNNDDLDRYFKESRILEKRSNKNYEFSSFDAKIDVPLTEHPEIFDNIDLKTNCPLKLIIFPRLIKTLQDNNPKLITLNKDSKRIFLEQTCFTPFDWESLRFPWIYQRKSCMEDIISGKYDILNTVIEKTEIIELQYGFQISPQKLMKEIKRRI